MIPEVFFSYRMDYLVDRLLDEFAANLIDPMELRTILVPNSQMKQWLLLEIAKRKGIAMGLKVCEIGAVIPTSPNSLELFCLLYTELSKCADVQTYIDGKPKRLLELADQLTSLFHTYMQFGKEPTGWQKEIFPKFQSAEIREPIICFGIDFLPPTYWKYLFQAPALSVYLFSPCVDFWEDICTERERKKIDRYWKKKGASVAKRLELDAYLREAPRNLANWGKIGRETLKLFDQTEEIYPPLQPDSLLKRVQYDLLTFQETHQPKIDNSIQLFLTGSSRLKEIECLRDEILRLDVPYSEIAVLAPNIEPYVPLIEFVFSMIPYRISGFDIASQSSFRQGLVRLLQLTTGRWDVEEVLTLFETPSFYRKQGWDQEQLEQFRHWMSTIRIKWGLDAEHRQEVLRQTLGDKPFQDQSSWEWGLDRLLESIVYFSPLQIDPDLFEELISMLTSLKNIPVKGEKTLSDWAECLDRAAQEYLVLDSDDEADQATYSAFRQLLLDLKNAQNESFYPFPVIQKLLLRPCAGQINASHLHAVRFTSIEEGASLPAKALFLIGMDEESFPRNQIASSLDLLRGQVPNMADRDRYFFLQALFSAQEYLRISYGHLSPDEGKPVGPSLVVQELLSGIDLQPITYRSHPAAPKPKHFPWPCKSTCKIPEGEITLPISDLRLLARHPWKFHLQKVHGIYLNETLEDSFSLQKAKLVRETMAQKSIELPPGLLGEALQLEVLEKANEWQAQLQEWNLKPISVTLRQSCQEAHWDKDQYVVPPLELTCNHCKVRLVGEIKQATLSGLICTNEDTIAGLLKSWPEALILAHSVQAPQVWMLRNGKTKKLVNIESSLKSFIEYYFLSLQCPSPLISDWADAFLRKSATDLEKKMAKGSTFEDPVVEWVLSRAELPPALDLHHEWSSSLKETFAELIHLYPSRQHAAV